MTDATNETKSETNDLVTEAIQKARESLVSVKDGALVTLEPATIQTLLGHIGHLDANKGGILTNEKLLHASHDHGMAFIDGVLGLMQRTVNQVQVITTACVQAGVLTVKKADDGGEAENEQDS